jgi:esterase/lipase
MIEALKSSRFLFIIPEKGQNTSLRRYRQLADFASELGLEVYMVDIKWNKHNSLLECTLEATRKIHEIVDELHPTEIFVLGFGIGAMLAAQIGYIFRADGLILCSMPTLFDEELSQFSKFKRYFLKGRIYKAKNKPSYPSRKISSNAILIYAEKERRKLEKVKNTRNAAFENATDIFVAKSAVSLRSKKYFEIVLSETTKLISNSTK